MKTKQHSSFFTLHSILAFLAALCFAALPARAQTLPSLSQIVSNVANATQPKEAYTATVTQTMTPPDTNVMAAAAMPAIQVNAVAQTTNVQTFETTFVPSQHKWVSQRAPSPVVKSLVQGQSATNLPSGQPGIRVTVNFDPFLESLLSSNETSVSQEVLDGRPCYRIDARSGQTRLVTLWVDEQHWYVPKAIAYMMNAEFAEVTCGYREVNGLWLPSQVMIHHALDGSQVDLEFGAYQRGGPK